MGGRWSAGWISFKLCQSKHLGRLLYQRKFHDGRLCGTGLMYFFHLGTTVHRHREGHKLQSRYCCVLERCHSRFGENERTRRAASCPRHHVCTETVRVLGRITENLQSLCQNKRPTKTGGVSIYQKPSSLAFHQEEQPMLRDKDAGDLCFTSIVIDDC